MLYRSFTFFFIRNSIDPLPIMTDSLYVPTLREQDVPECDSQQPQQNVGEQVESLVEGLQVYSRHPRSKTILQPLNQTSTLDSGNKGIRSCTQHSVSNFVSHNNLSLPYRTFFPKLFCVSISQSVQDTLEDPKWREAMQEKIRALYKNNTYDLVELPKGKKAIGCKWEFTVKHKADGSVERYTAKLVVKGFTKTYGINYQETFAPMAKMNSIGVVLSLTTMESA